MNIYTRARALSVVSLALILTGSAATSWAADVPGLYSTGVDNAEMPLALGVNDTHWEVQEAALGWMTPLYEKTNFCSSCGSVWVDHPQGDNMKSRPLAHPNHVQAAAPNRTFSWRQSFMLPADADLGTVTIKYKVGYDDQSLDANGGSTISGCNHTVWLNGTAYAMTASGSSIRTECEATIPAGSNFVNGANTIEFRVQNLATYYGFRWEKISATYMMDAGLPLTLAIDDPTEGLLTNDNTPTISGTTTAGASVTLTLVDMSGATVQTLTPAVDAQGNYTIDAMMLADGSYTLSASASDAANQMAMAGPRKFGIDSTAPAVTITSFVDGATVNDDTPTIAGVTEPGATVMVIIEDMSGMVVQTLTPVVDAQGNYTIDAMMLADGAYVITVTSADALGNEGSTSSTLNTSSEAMPMVMATITSPADGDVIIGDTVLVKGTVTAPVLVKLFAAVIGVNNTKQDPATPLAFELQLTLPAGTHTIEAKFDDEDGDEVIADSITITMKKDGEQPVAPVAISSPADGASVPAGTIVVSGAGEPGTTVVVTLGGQEQTVTVEEDGTWSATFMDVPKGDQTIVAKGGDGMSVSVALIVEGEDVVMPPGGSTMTQEEGCGCSSSASPGQSAPMWLLGIFGLMLMRRRKRRA